MVKSNDSYSMDDGAGKMALQPDEVMDDKPVFALSYSDDSDDDSYEMEWPRLRLIQALSPEVADGTGRPGDFVIEGLDETPSPLIAIPMARTKFRILRANKEDDPDTPVICMSNDAEFGVGTPGGDCAQCPFSKDRSCDLINEFILWVPDAGVFCKWQLQRGGIYTAKKIHTMIRQKKFGGFALRISSREAHMRGDAQKKYMRAEVSMIALEPGTEIPALNA